MQIVGQHYYFLPEFSQGRRALWENIDNDGMRFIDHVPKEIIDGKPNETEMKIDLKNGSIIQVVGADSFDSLRGPNPKTCVFSEYAYQNPRAYATMSPILRLNRGFAIFNTTPNGENHAKAMWDMAETNPDWWTSRLTVDDTGIFTPEDIDKERAEGMSEEMIQQEYYNSWSSSLVGSYYGPRIREMEEQGRIGVVPWDESSQVMTFWDLGMNDEMSIWFIQQHGFSYRLIDFYSNHGLGFEHYAKVLHDRPYRYSRHHVPHDAKNRELSSGMERSRTLDSLLREEVVVLGRPKAVQDKIEAVRWVLPKVWIDAEKCRDGINALKSYRQVYDERLKTWKDEPLHDWASHPCDALAYFAIEAREGNLPNGPVGPIPSFSSPSTHEDLFSAI